MDYRNLESLCTRWEASALRFGVDHLLTCLEGGVLSQVPGWLLKEEGDLYSFPGTGGPPRSSPRLTVEKSGGQAHGRTDHVLQSSSQFGVRRRGLAARLFDAKFGGVSRS